MRDFYEITDDLIGKFAEQLPWGIYFYDVSGGELRGFAGMNDGSEFPDTEKYLSDTIRDVCLICERLQKQYTETSPSGLVYIAQPLIFEDKIWAVLATYLSLGREGTWRRSLHQGPTVSDILDTLNELGYILTTHREVLQWFSSGVPASMQNQQERAQVFADPR